MIIIPNVTLNPNEVLTKTEFLDIIERAFERFEHVTYVAKDPDNFYSDYIVEGYSKSSEPFVQWENCTMFKLVQFLKLTAVYYNSDYFDLITKQEDYYKALQMVKDACEFNDKLKAKAIAFFGGK